jgi:hypothetical protein
MKKKRKKRFLEEEAERDIRPVKGKVAPRR